MRMTDTAPETTETTKEQTSAPTVAPGAAPTRDRAPRDRNERGGRDRRPRRDRAQRPRSEYDNKMLDIRRVTRVVAGGRRFSFSVTMVIGNGKGQVGVGIGKAGDTALAIEKATRNAKRHLITVPLTADLSIPHEVSAKYDASEVMLIPTPGKGFKAGSATRAVLEFAGVKHVSAKILSRSKNQLNNARATIEALKKLKPIPSKMVKREEGRNKHHAQGKAHPKKAVKSDAPRAKKETKKESKSETK